jgi:hypothetical protein
LPTPEERAVSSISNFVTFLNTMPKKTQPAVGPDAGPITDEDLHVLQIIGTAGLLSPPDLVKLASIEPDEAAKRVERLRTLNQLELVKRTDDDTLLLRLTPGGYATMKR